MHIENIGEMTIQLSSGDAWYVEVTEDDEPEITGCLVAEAGRRDPIAGQ